MKKNQTVQMVDGVPIILNDMQAIFNGLKKDKVIGIDLETTGFSAWKNRIALVQLYGQQSGTCGIIQVSDGIIDPMIKDLFTADRTFVVHNGVGFDMWFMETHGIPWRKSKWFDTLVGETVLASSGRRDIRKSLSESLRRRLGKEVDKTIEHGNWGALSLSARQIEYAAQDVLSLPALRETHLEKAKQSRETEALEMEMELAPLVAQMSINGLPLKKSYMREFVRDQKEAIKDATAFLYKKFGEINLGSWQQLLAGLHDHGIPVEKTGVEYLIPAAQAMAGTPQGEILEQVLIWKHGNQRIKMYSEEWMEENIINDWSHPHFWQCSADTTRFTSTKPNFQQIPKDSRHMIGNMKGFKIVSADYSQIEVRIAAHYAKDEVLLSALELEDVHTAMAAEIFGKPLNKITKEERKLSKALSFTLLFGGGAGTVYNHAKLSGGSMSEDQAEKLTSQFFGRFKGLYEMKKKAEKLARKDGPVIIRLPNSNRRILVGDSKRSTVILNTMVQGTAAVGIKKGILEAGRRGLDNYFGSVVHDEVVAAVPPKLAREYGNELKEAMIEGMKQVVDITIKVDVSIGVNWQA